MERIVNQIVGNGLVIGRIVGAVILKGYTANIMIKYGFANLNHTLILN
jgi:hypothetical protein